MSKIEKATLVGTAAGSFMLSMFMLAGNAEARDYHRHTRKPHAAVVAPDSDLPVRQSPPQAGVAGYFGPPPFYGYGPYWGYARGDLGFALLGALNGGGFRGFVECGNYYARYPGACGF